MRVFELGEIIAERTFRFEANEGASCDLHVKLGRPVPDPRPTGPAWLCPFQISGVGRDGVTAIFGGDSMQALSLALHTVAVELALFARKAGGRIVHHGHLDTTFLSGCRTALDYAGDCFPPEEP